MRIDGPQVTSSLSLNGTTITDLNVFVTTGSLNGITGSYATTGSLNSFTSSATTRLNSIETSTGSLNGFTSSANSRLNSVEGVTGSYATTGSNLFKGNQTISGSIIPAVDNTYDLGSSTYQFRDLYLSSASLYIDGTKVLGSTAQELQITTDTGQSFKILEAGSDNITLQSADGNIELKSSGGGDVILDPTTGVIALKGTTQVYAGNKVRSSDGNNIVFGDGLTVSGSVTITGFIEAQELRTTYISSSILYRSGSTKFGDELGDTHSFTGSLLVSGSISVPGSGLVSGSSQVSYTGLTNVPSGLVSGSSQVLNASGVWSGSAQLPSGIISGSAQLPPGLISGSSQLPSGTVSGSAQIDVMSTTNIARLATTGSNTFSGDITIQGNDSSAIKLFKLYSGSPAHVGFTIQDRTGTNTFYHNANGGGTGINGSLTITGATIVSGSAFTLIGGSGSSDTVVSNITAANGAAAELVIRGGDGTTNRRAAIRLYSNQISTGTAQWVLGASMSQSSNDSNFYLYSSGGTSTITTTQNNYVGINRTDPSFYLDVYANVANSFYTIAQFENRDYTSGTRSFIRVRNWLSAGGSYSSYFGQGQDGKTYIIANNSARGGDIVIDGGTGDITIAAKTRSNGTITAAYGGGQIQISGGATLSGIFQGTSTDSLFIGDWNTATKGITINVSNGNMGVGDVGPSQKLTVAGSIKMNQDAALRAGSSDNWIIGQDSGTNVIHLGSASVANDIRFDSSNQTGNVIIKSNGRLGVNTTDPATTFDVNGAMGLRSNNYFYFGHTTSNIGGWTTRMYANGAEHRFNANGFAFTNEGYGSATWLSINSSGNATFSGTITANNNITTSATLFLTKNIVAGEATPLHFNYTTSDGVGPAIRMGTGTQGFWDVQPSSNNTRLSFEWSDTTNALNLYSNGSVSVGSAIANVSNKLAVGGAVRARDTVYSWYQGGGNSWDGYQYLHLKTNLSSGASGNVEHTMSTFYGRLYSYSSAYIREGHFGFHNWSGTLYNQVSTGNFWSGGYSSSDGYVVLVVAIGGGSYIGVTIDWFQAYAYGFRDRYVTNATPSNSASGVF